MCEITIVEYWDFNLAQDQLKLLWCITTSIEAPKFQMDTATCITFSVKDLL